MIGRCVERLHRHLPYCQATADQGSLPTDIWKSTSQDKVLRLTPFDGQVQYFQADSAEVRDQIWFCLLSFNQACR